MLRSKRNDGQALMETLSPHYAEARARFEAELAAMTADKASERLNALAGELLMRGRGDEGAEIRLISAWVRRQAEVGCE